MGKVNKGVAQVPYGLRAFAFKSLVYYVVGRIAPGRKSRLALPEFNVKSSAYKDIFEFWKISFKIGRFWESVVIMIRDEINVSVRKMI